MYVSNNHFLREEHSFPDSDLIFVLHLLFVAYLYNTTGFIEKNRDKLPREATELLISFTNNFAKALAPSISNPDGDITAKVSGSSNPKDEDATNSVCVVDGIEGIQSVYCCIYIDRTYN